MSSTHGLLVVLFPKGEGCVALRAAQFCDREFHITLTHDGERAGTLSGAIHLHTSEGKPTEKLYGESGDQLRTYLLNYFFSFWSTNSYFSMLSDFIKVEKDDTVTAKGKGGDINKYEVFLHLWLLWNISNVTSRCDSFCLLVDRFSVTQAHDISNPSYMSYQKGNVIDKGWSYSMPPKNLPTAGQGSKECKKGGYDVGTRSPTGKSLNPT